MYEILKLLIKMLCRKKKLTSLLNEKQMVPNFLIISAVLPRAVQLLAIRNDFRLLTRHLAESGQAERLV